MVKNMTKGSPMKLIVEFAIPMLIGNIFQQVYSLVDTIIVGKFLGADALAGVGSTGSITFFMTSLIMGLCNGAGIIISQCFGSKNYDRMRQAITTLLYISGVFSIVITIMGTLFTPAFLKLLGVPDEIKEYFSAYLTIIFAGITGSVFYNAGSTILRSIGDSKTPLFFLIIASVLNIVLDIIFIRNFGLGVKGAAYATIISQFISVILCIIHLIHYREALHISGMPGLPDKTMIFLIFKIGLPTAFQSCVVSIGSMSVQRLINSFGVAAMAAFAAAAKISNLAIQVIVSIGTAMSVYSGQNTGIGDYVRIRIGLRKTLLLMCISSISMAAIVFIFKEKLMSVFLDPAKASESIKIGAVYLSIIGIAYIIAGIMQSYQNLLKGAGDVNICMAAGLSELTARIIFAYLLAGLIGVNGIWIATPISWGCGCIIPVIRYYTGKWKTKRLV